MKNRFSLLVLPFIANFPTLAADGDWKLGKDPKLIPTGMFKTDPSLEVAVWATSPHLGKRRFTPRHPQ